MSRYQNDAWTNRHYRIKHEDIQNDHWTEAELRIENRDLQSLNRMTPESWTKRRRCHWTKRRHSESTYRWTKNSLATARYRQENDDNELAAALIMRIDDLRITARRTERYSRPAIRFTATTSSPARAIDANKQTALKMSYRRDTTS